MNLWTIFSKIKCFRCSNIFFNSFSENEKKLRGWPILNNILSSSMSLFICPLCFFSRHQIHQENTSLLIQKYFRCSLMVISSDSWEKFALLSALQSGYLELSVCLLAFGLELVMRAEFSAYSIAGFPAFSR